jgi:glycosyltransferase involved in cell wall biosynthesis
VLADAYARLSRRIGHSPSRLEAAGFLVKGCESYLKEIEKALGKAGLARNFTYHGSVDRAGKLAFLGRLSVLSVPATYDEPKGMFLLEAMARGVPVVQPRRGAFTEIIEKTGGGLLVDPDNPSSLGEGLHSLWRERRFMDELSERAFQGVRAHYTVAHSADRLLAVYDEVVSRRASFSASVA